MPNQRKLFILIVITAIMASAVIEYKNTLIHADDNCPYQNPRNRYDIGGCSSVYIAPYVDDYLQPPPGWSLYNTIDPPCSISALSSPGTSCTGEDDSSQYLCIAKKNPDYIDGRSLGFRAIIQCYAKSKIPPPVDTYSRMNGNSQSVENNNAEAGTQSQPASTQPHKNKLQQFFLSILRFFTSLFS